MIRYHIQKNTRHELFPKPHKRVVWFWEKFMSCVFRISVVYFPCGRQKKCWSLRCSWSIACQRCSNYISILELTLGFNGLGRDNCKTRRHVGTRRSVGLLHGPVDQATLRPSWQYNAWCRHQPYTGHDAINRWFLYFTCETEDSERSQIEYVLAYNTCG